MPINQPSNQIKLTNVSIVRLKKGGKRFEIACYKNKVNEWRTGVETDLDEVLQISNVFVNVSKGEVAKANDLQKAFGKSDQKAIISEILKNGELQVSEKERDHELSNIKKDIATQVSEKCVDPATQKPYPVSMIEKAMAEANFSVKPNKNAKSQVLDCIHLIQTKSKLPLQRARMRIRITIPSDKVEDLKEKINASAETIEESKEVEGNWATTMLIDPAQFRVLNDLLQKECQGKGRLETVAFNASAVSTD